MIALSFVPAMMTVAPDGLPEPEEVLRAAVHQVIIPAIRQNFDQEGRPPWPDLSATTIQIKDRQGKPFPSKILHGWGDMYQSYGMSDDGWVFHSESAELMSTMQAPHGLYHEYGTTNMPERSFASMLPEDLDKIQEMFAEDISEGFWASMFPGEAF